MIEIPIGLQPRQSMDLVFEGTAVTLKLGYSNLTDTWRFDLLNRSTDPATPLLRGVPVVTGLDLLAPYGLSLGAMAAVAVERPGEDPGRDDLGTRVRLIHGSEDEFESEST